MNEAPATDRMPTESEIADLAYDVASEALAEIASLMAMHGVPLGYRGAVRRAIIDRIRDDMRAIDEG